MKTRIGPVHRIPSPHSYSLDLDMMLVDEIETDGLTASELSRRAARLHDITNTLADFALEVGDMRFDASFAHLSNLDG
jgi:hypothetical protein